MATNFAELIKNRRSTRKFTDQEINQEDVATLMRAALMAPTSKRSNGWEFILIDNKEQLEQLALCKAQSSGFIADSSLSIVVIADTTKSDVWIEDASIASIYLQLQAEALGLGSCWVQIRQRATAMGDDSEDYVRSVLNIPPHYGVLSVIALGYKAAERKPFDEEKLQWEKLHIAKYKDE